MNQIPEPTQKISPKAITVWRIRDFISRFITLLILSVFLYVRYYFDWYDWINIILLLMIGYVVLNGIYKLTIYPIYLQRTWRYEIDENYIQLKYGYFNKYHLIVPMSRIEYVNTNQGPLLRKFDLATLTFGTVTSSHEIPAIPMDEAKQLREKIVFYAQIEQSSKEKIDAEVERESNG